MITFNKLALSYIFYVTLEKSLRAFYKDGYIDLGLGHIIPILEKRDAILKDLYHTLWEPVSPVLVPLYFGLTLKFFSKPGVLKPSWGVRRPMIVITIILLFVIWIDTRSNCSDFLAARGTIEDFGVGNCPKTMLSWAFLLAMIVGTWIGWEWDGGLIEWFKEWITRRTRIRN